MSQINVDNIKNRLGSGAPSFPNGIDVSAGVTTFTNGLNVGTGASVFSPATNVLALGTNSAERVRVDSSGNLGIGTTSPAVTVHAEDAQAELQLKSTSGTNSAGLRFVPGGETNALYIYADGSRNINFDDHATSLISVRSAGGITFNGDTAAANALDDYEEGTWTPVLKDNSGNEATMTVQQGFYTKTGNIVNAWFQVAWSSLGSLTGNVRIEGWPVTSKSNDGQYYYIGATISNQTTVGCIAMAGNGTVANMQPLTGPTSNQTGSNLSSSGRMMSSLTYPT